MATFLRALDVAEQRLEQIPFYYIFVPFFVLCGLILVFTIPPLQVPDENAHLIRAYQISGGTFISPQHKDTNGHLVSYHEKTPLSFLELNRFSQPFEWQHAFSSAHINSILAMPLKAGNTTSIDIPNTGQYSPISYLPQALAAWLGTQLGFSLGTIFYLMRSAAVCFAAACVFLSMKLLQEKVLLISLIALMPMSLYEFASVSADSANFALTMLITAFLLHLRSKAAHLDTKELALLLAAALTLGLIKQVYGVILLLYFLIPSHVFGNKKSFYLLGLSLLAVFLAVSMAWTSVAYGGSEALMGADSGIDPQKQLDFIKHSPLQYIGILFATLSENLAHHCKEFVGLLGWCVIQLPTPFYSLYAILLFMGSISGKLALSLKQRSLMVAGVLTSVFVIFLNQYLTWTPVGAPLIGGFQGRYVIPLALMMLASFSCLERLRYESLLACTSGLASVIVTIWSLHDFFY